MRAIGEVRDDFAKIGGIWYEKHKITRVVLDGTEEDWYRQRGTDPYVFRINIEDYLRVNKNICLSNYFNSLVNGGYSNMTDGTCTFRYASGDENYFLYFCTSNQSTVADFKTWLSTHNTEVIYILAEPTLTPCTAGQIAVLEEMTTDELYEITNISGYSGDIDANLKLKYNFITPAPSPDRESDINSVGDNVNEFDISTNDYVSKCTLANNIFTTSELNQNDRNAVFGYSANNNYTFKSNKTYYLSAEVRLKSGTASTLNVLKPNTPGFDVVNIKNPTFSNEFQEYICSISNNTENDIVSGRFLFQPANTSLSNAIFEIKNIKLAEVNSSYSPYNMGVATIEKCNKNLFDKDNVINAYLNNDGTITSNSTFRVSNYIDISSFSKLTISGNYGSSELNCFYDNNKNYISGAGMGASTTKTIDVPQNARYIRCTVRNNVLDEYQLEGGSTATTYIPHQSTTYSIYTQQPMRAIGEVRDDFIKQAGVWYERHKIGRVVFTGAETENWRKSTTTAIDKFILDNSSYLTNTSSLCNYFKYEASNNAGAWYNNDNSQLVFSFTEYGTTNLDDWKTWLATHNIELIQPLAEPTLTQCTEAQTTILNSLKDTTLYEDETNITTVDVIDAGLSLHYNFITPAPSPDRESEVKVVKSNVTVKIANSLDSTATGYESQTITVPLPSGMELCKIGEYQDYIYKSGDKWYKHKAIGKVVLNGNETWNYTQKTNNVFYCDELTNYNKTNNFIPYSNYYLGKGKVLNATSASANGNYTIQFISNENYNRFFIVDNNYDNTTDFTSWLSTHNTDVYYVLAEAVEEEITNSATKTALESLQNISLYKGFNYITTTNNPKAILEIDYYSIIEGFEFYITTNGFLVVPAYNIKYKIDPMESNIPSMPEATEASVKIAGADGDIPLMTTYDPINFNIVCYTEDNLDYEEKVEEESKLNRFINTIKNKTKQLVFESEEKLYDVRYNGSLTTIRYPKHLKFSIPLKSSKSYAKYFIEREETGNATFTSDTVKEVGPVFTITGPATEPRIALNDYQMYYASSLLSGEKLIIDANNSTVTLIDTNNVKHNAMGYYNHEFPKIKSGTNVLQVREGLTNASQLKINWYDLKF